ncbi:MAG: guanylate kinase [Phototrophicaceae bacterium]
MSATRGLFFVFVGPGGTGKNTLMSIIMERHPDIKQLATATTRAMRSNEQDGRERIFVSLERFREMIAQDELLEYQEVTPGKFYGIPRTSVEDVLTNGQHLIADIEVRGAEVVLKEYKDDAIIIYVTVPGATKEEQLDTLKQRMLTRLDREPTEDDWREINQRLSRAINLEFPFSEKCEHIIVNDDLAVAVEQVDAIVKNAIAERVARIKEA